MDGQTFLPTNLYDIFDLIRRAKLSWYNIQLVRSTRQSELVESDVKIGRSICAIVCQLD